MNKLNKFAEKRQHFSIRKLTIGAASVLLGTSLWLGANGNVAHADEATNGDAVSSIVEKSEDTSTSDNKVENAQNNNVQASDLETAHEQVTGADKAKAVAVVTPETKATENATTDTNKDNKGTNDVEKTSAVAANKEVKAAVQTDPAKDTYNVKVTLKNIARADGKLNLNPNWPVNLGWVYNFTDQVLTLKDVKDGTRVYSLGLAPTGFKLMNPEVLTQNFRMDGNTAYVDGKDANVTLEYAPISPVLVKYVDADTGEVLSSSSVGANTSTTASREYELGDKTAIAPSKFLVKAIDIPGYEVVGNKEIVENYTNVQSLGNLNYQVVTFKYKKVMNNENPKNEKGSGAQYGEYFGPAWNTIDPADIFNVSGVKGQTYEEDNGDMEGKIQKIVEKYQNQGYTFMGIFNYHKNTDFRNWDEGGTSINLIPNKAVTVRYVDEQGNELSPEDILSGNSNNPDQTNKGVNPDKHWHSAGTWTATPKEFNGYTLRTTYGATKGKYTPYKYVVTFEYVKDTPAPQPNPDPTPDPQPDNPTPSTPDPQPETPSEPGTNVTPHPQDPTTPETPNNDEPDNPAPAPHAGKTEDNGNTGKLNVKNLATTPAAQNGQTASEKTLPQTGEEANKAGVFGAIAAGLGLICLAGAKKRRKN